MKLAVLAALSALALAGAAAAQPARSGPSPAPPEPAHTPAFNAAREAMRDACSADFRSLCPGLRGTFAFICLARDNADKLTPECKASVAKLREAGEAERAATAPH